MSETQPHIFERIDAIQEQLNDVMTIVRRAPVEGALPEDVREALFDALDVLAVRVDLAKQDISPSWRETYGAQC